MKNLIFGFIIGSFISSAFAQINTNEAIYGRMLGTGIATFLTTPSSANLASSLTDETGTGPAVFGTNPTIIQTSVLTTNLPTCNGGSTGQIGFVSDALAPSLGVTLSGGGALTVGVRCNGTNWLVF